MDKPVKPQKKLLTKNEIKKKVVTEDQKKKVLDTIMRSPRQRTFGQKASDWVTRWFGSWTFLIIFFFFMAVWIAINIHMVNLRWDPYPFILFNLVLSCLAAIQAPIILMSQNRQTERDRLRAEQNYRVDKKAELEIEDMQRDLEIIKQLIRDIKNSKNAKK
ncbi:MAG: DUF1003 domain-containing protein [Candidatus Peribacteraceae bacterium]|nr:DUF1003 domain-containing protein [Candidatus Peribacteraceae bacterium]